MAESGKWDSERRAVKAVQIAFDVGLDVSKKIRLEAVEQGINPSDRVRQILGLSVNSKPVRPRLSISLTPEDFEILGEAFGVSPADRLKIRQLAAERLIEHLKE